MSDNHVMWVMNARIAFAPSIFKKSAIAGDSSSTPRYNCGLILPPKDKQVAEIEKVMKELALGHDWKGDATAEDVYKMLVKKDRLALHDGDDKPNYAGYPGNVYLSPNADTRPTVVNRDRSQLTESDGVIYSGCYVNAKVELWVQDNKWGQRVNATLLGVQFVKDGDAFGSGAAPANPDDFPDLDASDGSDEDEMMG
jgi:hypothetical protein